MALGVTNDGKNNLAVSNEDKQSNQTWADLTVAWQDVTSPWSAAGSPVVKESKNNLTVSNESKN